jgi:hypothetical protein
VSKVLRRDIYVQGMSAEFGIDQDGTVVKRLESGKWVPAENPVAIEKVLAYVRTPQPWEKKEEGK